jgi:hypothetical protein
VAARAAEAAAAEASRAPARTRRRWGGPGSGPHPAPAALDSRLRRNDEGLGLGPTSPASRCFGPFQGDTSYTGATYKIGIQLADKKP